MSALIDQNINYYEFKNGNFPLVFIRIWCELSLNILFEHQLVIYWNLQLSDKLVWCCRSDIDSDLWIQTDWSRL